MSEVVIDGEKIAKAERLAGGGSRVVLRGAGSFAGAQIELICSTDTAERLGVRGPDGVGGDPAKEAIAAVSLMLLALQESDSASVLDGE